MALNCDLNLPANRMVAKEERARIVSHGKNGLEMVTGLGGPFQTVLNRIQNYNVWNGLLDWIKVNKSTHSIRCEQLKPDLDGNGKTSAKTVHTHARTHSNRQATSYTMYINSSRMMWRV